MTAICKPNPGGYRPINLTNLHRTPQWGLIPAHLQRDIEIVAQVYPFRVNPYILEELIDWDAAPDDPIYRLTFPHRDMLTSEQFSRLAKLVDAKAQPAQLKAAAAEIRMGANPHPAGQLTHNLAKLDGKWLPGVQHKYDQTVLFFPSQGQTCHAYCTFCFRWAQFVSIPGLKIAAKEISSLVSYLKRHQEVSDVLITGGDPMFMGVEALKRCIEPLLDPELSHVTNIRIGTKSIAYWPQRYTSDQDSDELLGLFGRVAASGKRLALMAHFDHPREMSTPTAQEALGRIIASGAVVRVQAPLVRHINDDPEVWASLWQNSVRLGAVPYYMFIARDTGPQDYFRVSLYRAWRIFRDALGKVSGLARTVRGPSMSAHPGKVRVLGVSQHGGQAVFVLDYLQARDPDMVGRPFFAKFDTAAAWLDDLEPATPADAKFFPAEPEEYRLTVNR
jgi:KamA family protein